MLTISPPLEYLRKQTRLILKQIDLSTTYNAGQKKLLHCGENQRDGDYKKTDSPNL